MTTDEVKAALVFSKLAERRAVKIAKDYTDSHSGGTGVVDYKTVPPATADSPDIIRVAGITLWFKAKIGEPEEHTLQDKNGYPLQDRDGYPLAVNE